MMAGKSLNRKTTTTKANTNIVEEVVETKAASSSATKKKVQKKFTDIDGIVCRSCTAGQLIMVGKKTGNVYTWGNFGDKTEVEFSDIRAAKFTKSDFIYKPMFIIEDDDLLEQWTDIADVYANIYSLEDLEQIFNISNVNTFERAIKELPKGVQESIKTMAAEKISNGSLDSIRKIKAIDEILGTELMLFAVDE